MSHPFELEKLRAENIILWKRVRKCGICAYPYDDACDEVMELARKNAEVARLRTALIDAMDFIECVGIEDAVTGDERIKVLKTCEEALEK